MELISLNNFERALPKEHPCEISSKLVKEEMSFEAIVDGRRTDNGRQTIGDWKRR